MISILLSAWAAPCALDVPPNTPFTVAPPKAPRGAHLIVLVREANADLSVVRTTFDLLDARGLPGTLSIRATAPSDELEALILDLKSRNHGISVRVPTAKIRRDPTTGPRLLRKTLKPLTSITGKIRIIEGGVGNEGTEAIFHRIGLRTVLETNGPATGRPRAQLHLDGQVNNGVILPAGPYTGPCGSSALASPFTPAAADRVTQALYGAREHTFGIVRVTLQPTSTDETDVLARWLDEVVLKAKIPVISPSHARDLVLTILRDEPLKNAVVPASSGRIVPIHQIEQAAEQLKNLTVLPRVLAKDLNLTEAFQGFALLLADALESDAVRLLPLRGPHQLSNSKLKKPVELSEDAVRKLAAALVAEAPASIPSALSVEGHLLNAPELMVLFASIVRGDVPIARSIEVPEPSNPGLGWGVSGL